MYYQSDINTAINTIDNSIKTIGNNLYKTVLLGSTNNNFKRNLRILSIGRNFLKNQIALVGKPTFLYKITVLDPSLETDISILYDGISSLASDCVANSSVLNLTDSQFLETIQRFYANPGTNLSPLTTSDIYTIIVNNSIYIYSTSNIFTSNAEVTVTNSSAVSVTSYLDNTSDLVDFLNNKGSVDSLIPNIIDITKEYKDREDLTKTNTSPYSIQAVQIATASTTNSSSGIISPATSGHTQNTDSYLAKNTSNQVSASEIRIHIDNTDIHLTQAEIQALIDAGVGGGISDVVDDTTPQLGGNLDLNSKNITGNGSINITGSITSTGNVNGRDLSTDGTKLDGIEANADVTDATNVNAAGATMNTDTDVSGNSWVLDQDDMSSDSDTKVPTQQSVKAYVDNGNAKVAQQFVDIPDSNTTVDFNNEDFTVNLHYTSLTANRTVTISNSVNGSQLIIDLTIASGNLNKEILFAGPASLVISSSWVNGGSNGVVLPGDASVATYYSIVIWNNGAHWRVTVADLN